MDTNFWSEFGMALLNAIIPVLVTAMPVLMTALVALLVQYIRLAQEKIKAAKPDEYAIFERICEKAVYIAEQLKLAGFIEDKKAYAINYVQKKIDETGIKIDLAMIEEEIERIVFEELNKGK